MNLNFIQVSSMITVDTAHLHMKSVLQSQAKINTRTKGRAGGAESVAKYR